VTVAVDDIVAGCFHPAYALLGTGVETPTGCGCYLLDGAQTFEPWKREFGHSAGSGEFQRYIEVFGISSWHQLGEGIGHETLPIFDVSKLAAHMDIMERVFWKARTITGIVEIWLDVSRYRWLEVENVRHVYGRVRKV
jgi:hypothetical protein